MMNLEKLMARARHNRFWLGVLNVILYRIIPFNQPHRIRIHEISDNGIVSVIPMKRKNHNHIGGIHACGLATVAEFTSGLVLLRSLGIKKYRLIMESIEVSYHYQAKATAYASFEMDPDRLNNEVLGPLATEDAVYIRCEIPVKDEKGNHLCTAYTNWQVKPWSKVRTKP
jgi:acyl-coenzyme A thioesterase PaaI-like protein